jgi:subtilisin-like proprotein convertase family protein
MKKLFLLFFALWGAVVSMAQTSEAEKNVALQFVSANRTALGLTADDLNNLIVSSSYVDKSAGNARLVYLQQTFKGVPVYNQYQVLAFKNNQLVSNQGNRVAANKIAASQSPIPSFSAESAVRAALADRGIQSSKPAIVISRSNDGQKIEFSDMGASHRNITAQLMWVPSEDGKELRLGWQVYIEALKTADMWQVRIDAANGTTLGTTNLTVYCSWDGPNKYMPDHSAEFLNDLAVQKGLSTKTLFDFRNGPASVQSPTSPTIVNGASYLVIPYPVESPSHGPATLKTDPWTLAGGNAVSLKWHSDGANDYTNSRGNNVWAKEDRANDDEGTIGVSAQSSTTPDPLTFNFPPDYTVAPTTPSFQQFAITNLFYWNNIMHDISYVYGFDEAAANFQANNQGRGGAGNDFVYADAQDGSGTSNANFGTPADGSNGRMQMYLFTSPNPDRDGDVDNGVISHEYGHGISHRLTGGPASGAGCLGNRERGDEGWSDYFALMVTTDWSTALVTDGFNKPRPMGTYVLAQPITGSGIRVHPYCTNMSVDPWTYSGVQSSGGEVHDIGEIWCSTIWDMTWDLIQDQGINPNLFNPAGTGGNSIAMKLVIMGEKLQKCSPGFLDSRDGILAADQLLYNGQFHCIIVRAFARRGMGLDAIQGSSNATNDQTQGFSIEESSLLLTQNVTQQSEGGAVTYTNKVTAYCGALNNYLLTDTLPNNVTYVSGGTYNAATRVVSFPVNLAVGASQTYSFTVTINAGSYFPPVNLIDEQVTGAAIPTGWTATTTVPGSGNPKWVSSTAQSHSAPNSLFGVNAAVSSDMRISMDAAVALGATPPVLSFWHNYNTEPGWDGGVVEISTNGGTTWLDLGANMTQNGYNGTLGAGVGNNLANRAAFTGNSGGFIQTKINLQPYANQNAMFRFRCGSDDNTAATGWYVDDILLRSQAVVNMRSNLFNGSNVRVHTSDTFTIILPPAAGCPVVTTQPSNTMVCATSTATFTAAVAGVGMTYLWQESTNGGGTWNNLTNVAPYSGVGTTTLTINPTTLAMNNNQYRLFITTAACPTGVVSAPAVLNTVAASIGGTVTPATTNVCGTTNSGTLTLSGNTGSVIRWESATALAGPYTPIANTTNTYTFNNITQTMYYRAVVQVPGCVAVNSSVATVNFTASLPLTIVADPGTTLCAGDPTKLTVVETSAPTPVGTLYAQTGAAGASPVSQNFETGNDPFDNQAAEDFVVPANTTWTITQVSAGGLYFNGGGPSDSYNVTIYNNAATNIPGTVVTYTGGANPVLAIPATSLTAGTYWISIQSNMTFAVGGEWAWGATGTVAIGNAWKWQNPGAGFGTPCTTWGNGATSCIPGSGANLIFNLTGTSVTAAGQPVGGTYLWTPAAGLSSTTSNPVAASPAVTTTYTVRHDNGSGCIRQASITITVNQRPAITAQPANTAVCAGGTANITAGASGTGATYQWQVSTDGGVTWTNVSNGAPYSGATTTTLTIAPATIAMNGYRYRLVVSGICPPSANSNGAILTVNALPVVTITPSVTCGGVAGINGTLLTASSPTGGNFIWTPATGLYTNPQATAPYTAGTPTATVYAAPTANTVYTVTATNGTTGCTGTGTVTVNYTPVAPTVTPPSATICLGQVQPLTITSSLSPVTQTFASGPISVAIPEGTFPTGPYPGGSNVIAVSGIPAGSVISKLDVTLNITHAYVGDVVAVLKAPNGNILNLDAALSATNNAGADFANTIISSAGTKALSAGVAPFNDIFKADAVVGNITIAGFNIPSGPIGFAPNVSTFGGLYSTPNGNWTIAMYDAGAPDVGTLTSWSLSITYGPQSLGIWSPTAGLYTNAAGTTPYTGTPLQTVYASPTTSTNYTVTVANGTCTSPATTVPITVNMPIAITSQPTNVAVCTNGVAAFTVVATGTAIAHHWRVSTDNGNTWTDVANGGVYNGATTATLTITAPPVSMNGYFYKDSMTTAPCTGLISSIAKLTVNPLPTIGLTAIPYTSLLPGLTTTLTTTVTPSPAATYTWYRDGAVVAGATAGTLPIDIDGLGSYYVRVTDINGCTNVSNTVMIRDSASGRVFIYPNPNSGIFQVRYYSTLYSTGLPRGINIYDAKGARVITQKYTINAPYARMDVDMRKYGTGTYWVEVVDLNGNRLAMGRVLIVR